MKKTLIVLLFIANYCYSQMTLGNTSNSLTSITGKATVSGSVGIGVAPDALYNLKSYIDGITTNQRWHDNTTDSSLLHYNVMTTNTSDVVGVIGVGGGTYATNTDLRNSFYIGTQASESFHLITGFYVRATLNASGMGIGTILPTATLEVKSRWGGDNLIKAYNDENATKDSTFVVTNSAYVGIGTATPTMKLDVNGNIKADTIFCEPPHTNWSFADSAVAISGGTNVQITNATDSLFSIFESDGISYLDGDTAELIFNGSYNVIVDISGYGTNAVDWSIQVAYKRGATTYYTHSAKQFTTTAAINRNGGEKLFYLDNMLSGDKIWIVLTRLSGSGDFTATTGTFFIQLYYRKP